MSRSAPNTELYNIIGNAIDFSAITFTSNKKYTFYEPNWLYTVDALKLIKYLNPNFDVETILLLAPQKDIASGAVQDMQYWIDRKYINWSPPASTGVSNVTYEKDLTVTSNQDYTLSLPKFDPSLGTLYSVAYSIGVKSMTISWTIENQNGAPLASNIIITRINTISSDNSPFVVGINPDIHGIPINLAATDGVPDSGTDYQNMIGYSIPDLILTSGTISKNLIDYIGDGSLSLDWTVDTIVAFPDLVSATFSTEQTLFFTVTYTYRTFSDTVQAGFLPSVLDQNALSLSNIKLSENTFIAPKFIPVFFIVNNIKGKTDTIWTLTDVTDPQNPNQIVVIKGGPYFIWRFSTIGSFTLRADVSDKNGNIFTAQIDNLINIVSKSDYINFIESQLDSRKISIQNK